MFTMKFNIFLTYMSTSATNNYRQQLNYYCFDNLSQYVHFDAFVLLVHESKFKRVHAMPMPLLLVIQLLVRLFLRARPRSWPSSPTPASYVRFFFSVLDTPSAPIQIKCNSQNILIVICSFNLTCGRSRNLHH